MPDSTPAAGNEGWDPTQEEHDVDALVYGLRERNKAQVRLLVEHLLALRCAPLSIFRIDKMGRLLGVVDGFTKRTFYVTVIKWGPGRPVIEWTAESRLQSFKAKARADRALRNFTTPGNPPPWWVSYKVRGKIHRAKTPPGAS